MIYLLDKNGKEFAVAPSEATYLLNFEKALVCIDENGIFYSPSADGTERKYIRYIHINGYDRKFDIVGFDYKCKHYRLTASGVPKEDVARRLF